MGCKIVVLLCLSLAILFMITSKVAARDLAEETSASLDTTKQDEDTNGVNDAKYPGSGYVGPPGYGPYPGGGRGGYPGGGRGGNGRGRCRYGCCRQGYYGGCRRCCSYAGEAVDAVPEAKPRN